MVEEFWAALGAYVREDADGGLLDAREETLRGILAATPAATVVELMGEVPWDLAALCSGVVGVQDPTRARAMARLHGTVLCDAVRRFSSGDQLPLATEPDHPAAALFAALLESVDGCALYRDVAAVLCAARDDTDVSTGTLRACLYAPSVPTHEGRSDDGREPQE